MTATNKCYNFVGFRYSPPPLNVSNITRNGFPPKNEPHAAKLNFLGVLKYFHRNCHRTFLGLKSDYRRMKLRITQKVISSQQV